MKKKEGAWRCICTDYNTRHLAAPGSFLCKHILAALFKLAELKACDNCVPPEEGMDLPYDEV